MLKRLFKVGLVLLALGIVLGVIGLLSLDTILRLLVQRNLHQQTGMTARIGKFHLGLLKPVVEVRNLQLFNSAEFGGQPFLLIPEIYVEYDRAALATNRIHITLLRFNLGELDVVKGLDGQTNFLSLGMPAPAPTNTVGKPEPMDELKQRTGLGFQGIDCLNLTVGKFKYLDLQDRRNDREQPIAIDHLVLSNLTSQAALVGGIGLLVGMRSGDFFGPLITPGGSGPGQSTGNPLKQLGW